LKISYQQTQRIMDMAKSKMVNQSVKYFWSSRKELSHDDKVLLAFIQTFNTVLGTDYSLDLGVDVDYEDATQVLG